jgi:hypothetical protein
MDSQAVEILGCNRLISDIVAAGLEVARPERDRGVDLIAYRDLAKAGKFVARPIQMKAASARVFSVDRKYERIDSLILAYVWGVRDVEDAGVFAMSYPQAVAIAKAMGWTNTVSWRRGGYMTTAPSAKLRKILGEHRMTADRWVKLIAGDVTDRTKW